MQRLNGNDLYYSPAPANGGLVRFRRTPPGQSRIGQYNLIRTLGRGSFGVVKEGVHIRDGNRVAIKLIRKENIGHTPGFYTEIEREIEILGELDHPNIIKYKGVHQTGRHIAIVLEYVGGGELYSFLERCGRFNEEHARLLFSQIASSVQYMHRNNIVHRDLKLENILMVSSRHLKIADFGLAKGFCPGNDRSQTQCGTALYAAPEQYMGGRVYSSLPGDVWSCGVILYEMVCGRPPFQDPDYDPSVENSRRIYQRIWSVELTFPPFVSEDLQDLIRMMLVIDPSQRCTIEEVTCHPWLRSYRPVFLRPRQQRPVAPVLLPPPPVPRHLRRHPIPAAPAAVLQHRAPTISSEQSSLIQFHSARSAQALPQQQPQQQLLVRAPPQPSAPYDPEAWLAYYQQLSMNAYQQMLMSPHQHPMMPPMPPPPPLDYRHRRDGPRFPAAQHNRDEPIRKTCFGRLLELLGITPRIR